MFTLDECKTILEAFVICSGEGLSPAIAAEEEEISEVRVFDKIIKKYPHLCNDYYWLAKEYDKYR